MKRPLGFIIDSANHDVILFGLRDEKVETLTLDDLARALRISIQSGLGGLWVSIEPLGDSVGAVQKVVLSSGINKSHIGNILFAADYLFKKIALENVENRVEGVETYVQRSRKDLTRNVTEKRSVSTRFELCPREPKITSFPLNNPDTIYLKECGICAIDNTIFAEIDGRKIDPVGFVNQPARNYIMDFNFRWVNFEASYHEFASLHAVFLLFELAKRLVTMMPPEDVLFWSTGFTPIEEATQDTVPVLKKAIVEEGRQQLTLSGGIRLGTIATRMESGDLSGMRDAVLLSRPSKTAPCWNADFKGEWILATHTAPSLEDEKIARLYIEGQRFHKKGDFALAVDRFDNILKSYPDSDEVLLAKSLTLRDWGLSNYNEKKLESALESMLKVASTAPRFVESHHELANTLRALGRVDEAIGEYREAINLQPKYAPAYYGLALALKDKGQQADAVSELKKFLMYCEYKDQETKAQSLLAELRANEVSARGDKNKGLKSYSNPQYGFTCDYPANWVAFSRAQLIEKGQGWIAQPEDLVIAFVSQNNPDNNVNVQAFNIDQEKITSQEVAEAIRQLDDTYPQKYSNFKKIMAGEITINGAKGFEYVYTSSRLGVALQQRVITLVKSKKGFTITCTALKDQYDRLNEVSFIPFLESFIVK